MMSVPAFGATGDRRSSHDDYHRPCRGGQRHRPAYARACGIGALHQQIHPVGLELRSKHFLAIEPVVVTRFWRPATVTPDEVGSWLR